MIRELFIFTSISAVTMIQAIAAEKSHKEEFLESKSVSCVKNLSVPGERVKEFLDLCSEDIDKFNKLSNQSIHAIILELREDKILISPYAMNYLADNFSGEYANIISASELEGCVLTLQKVTKLLLQNLESRNAALQDLNFVINPTLKNNGVPTLKFLREHLKIFIDFSILKCPSPL